MSNKDKTGIARIRILIADSHGSVRSALRLLFEEEPNIEVTGEVSNIGELLAQSPRLRPDIVLLEWDMTRRRAKEIVPALYFNGRRPAVVALSSHPEERTGALNAGADMFVYEGDPPETLLSVVKDCCKLVSER